MTANPQHSYPYGYPAAAAAEPVYPPPPPPTAPYHLPPPPVSYAPPPPALASAPRSPYADIGRPWSSGIFDCGQDQTNALTTAFFPCVTFGQIAEILDEGRTSCSRSSFLYLLMSPALFSCWILGSSYRHRLRMKYNLVEAPAEDWNVHLFCPCCSLCQEFRELKSRGIDPSLGWMGYLARQQEMEETSVEAPAAQKMSV